jgi:hypothetical protein
VRVTAVQKNVLTTLRYASLAQVFRIDPSVVVEKGA